ncbi:MAG TPA: protein-glutamate O-methyltransferase CheR [Desulfuromonadaceae bacterium]
MHGTINDQTEPPCVLSDREFERLGELIRAHCGIKMPAAKKPMLEARLHKRLRALGLKSFREYCDLLAAPAGGAEELVQMIDAVTTHKTDFFREPAHFRYLAETVLPDYAASPKRWDGPGFAVWSAGCSTGEEAYTLGIVLCEFAAAHRGFRFAITATDISAGVLEKAALGVYGAEQVKGVPPEIMCKYFLRCRERERRVVRIVPELRSVVSFMRANLMDERYCPFTKGADAIFCRNVIIYFHRNEQYRLLAHFCRSLKSGGHLFLGHSETVHGFDLPLVRTGSTVYRKVT